MLVRPTSGEEFCLPLTQSQYMIGRLPDNDIVLADPFVSRQHCKLEQIGPRWHIIDLHSQNHTYLERSSGIIKIKPKNPDKVFLDNKDVICILDWKLEFHDENITKPIFEDVLPIKDIFFVYNVSQKALYLQKGDDLTKLKLRPQLNKMVAYMSDRNLEQGEAVCCTFEELKKAIWGIEEADLRPDSDIRGLARELRKLFEACAPNANVDFLETQFGVGYILNIKWK
ncbi:FHA domain-containing protein [Candidatus Synechococcus calcipolaris G9]|uniref:FHA domain-containing protein n=1 Tax=Candidatus Synechococcus calcipolaris G9 TaxID=1497997 RepID=A0ABT6EZ04_9SYNE|nr:FHA domain-containing protein [Candidatus Synechococcus calcipolaris]MDG2990573.1 FHA domain-containing protein [Candidatus Synechococcus calcipolaris G9]